MLTVAPRLASLCSSCHTSQSQQILQLARRTCQAIGDPILQKLSRAQTGVSLSTPPTSCPIQSGKAFLLWEFQLRANCLSPLPTVIARRRGASCILTPLCLAVPLCAVSGTPASLALHDRFEQLRDLYALTKGSKDVPRLIGIEAGVVLLTSLLFIAGELVASRSIETKHQIVADTFVFLAAIVEVMKGCRIELPGAAGQRLCVVVVGEVLCPELGKLAVLAR